jgi:hypothetical protein
MTDLVYLTLLAGRWAVPQSTSIFLLVISLPIVTERYIYRSLSHLAISSVACYLFCLVLTVVNVNYKLST